MKSRKVTKGNMNEREGNGNALPVSSKHFNDMYDDVSFVSPVTKQQFTGTISAERSLTHYNDYKVITNIVIKCTLNKVIGAGAEIRLIGDGSNTPDLSAFTKSASSETYNTGTGKINKTIFYYDGTEVFYSHTILN